MRGILAGIVSAITWGTVFVFGQFAVKKGCHPILLSFIRFFSASIFLFIYLLFQRIKFRIKKEDFFLF
ncbi:EamA family transporter [bacterium]|nr:EamA family transporter [bacterium]